MKLKDFIKTAISDITSAVCELQSELDNGSIINPTLARGDYDSEILVENEIRKIERLEFDVAVTATEASEIEGDVKAGISIFGAKAGTESSAKTENVSRLTFSIPLVLPSAHVRTPQEVMRDKRPKKPTS